MKSLCLHSGANSVSRDDVFNAPTPAPTNRHVPIPHGTLVERVEQQLAHAGYQVAQEQFGLTRDGDRFFGLLQLVRENDEALDYSIILGLRNAHDKSFAAGIVGGAGIFVCDNLSFSGEIKVARKHTTYIMRDLNGLVHRAISKLAGLYRQQQASFDAYKATTLTDDRAKALLVEAVKRKVIGCTALPKVVQEWEVPSHEEFSEPNVWRLFNAVTEVAKGWSPEVVVQRTQLLHGLCDLECGLNVCA